ncbi:quinate pathway repressor protein [Colletotrichum tofieldiae]|uniref:Quinate pathway repressor protein n=1 Tax=Colletotrichum tofieldiae TaxID=708197 RepID=A0A166Z859_9PEZI|nr:quinate pathway repressor protein [Colletotrichum tofieldiae]
MSSPRSINSIAAPAESVSGTTARRGSRELLASASLPLSNPNPQRSPSSQGQWRGFTPSQRSYAPDASIALVGIRGTGRSTLAVMASSALGFRLLDADQQFLQTTGLSRASYKAQHGATDYLWEELKLMRSMLYDNPTRAIIACGPGAVERTGQAWLSEYSQTHPVIYILRDAEEIKCHLKVWDTDAISRLISLSGPTHRSLSNFEFYNISDGAGQEPDEATGSGCQSPKSLRLKRVEDDFLNFIFNITHRAPQGPDYHIRDGPGSLPPERRPYTYSLNLPLSVVQDVGFRLRNIQTTADVAELVVSLRELRARAPSFDELTANHLSRNFYAVKRYTKLPIILNIQSDDSPTTETTDASFKPDPSYYSRLLNYGLRLAPDYLCVDLEANDDLLRGIMAAKGTTKIIGHYFDGSESPDGWCKPDLRNKLRLAELMGCDIVRICREAKSPTDNFATQHFVQNARKWGADKIPLIAYNTGRYGRMSCFMNSTFTPVTHSLLRTVVPKHTTCFLLTIEEAQKALYSSFLLDTVYFGIYGSNVSQSLSPAMHNAAFKSCGMPHEYKIFQFSTLNELRRLVSDDSFGGASITAPFKKEIFAIVDFTSPEAQAIGAVNTLVPLRSSSIDSLLDRNRSGPVVALYGDNTDWIGIHTCIRHNLSPINNVRRRTTALIIGAGGMARAAMYALLRLGVRNVFIHNRSVQNAEELVRHFERYNVRNGDESACPFATRIGEANKATICSPVIRVISKKEDQWPEGADFPTIIISCIPTQEAEGCSSIDTSLSPGWFGSPTGGVAIEVGLCLYLFNMSNRLLGLQLSYTPIETPLLTQVRKMSDHGWIAVDGLKILPEQGTRQFELFTARKAPRSVMREEVLRAYKTRMIKQQTERMAIGAE